MFKYEKTSNPNGNQPRRPPARLIALYEVFKSFGQAFSKAWRGAGRQPREDRLAECEAEPHEKKFGGARGGSPDKYPKYPCVKWGGSPEYTHEMRGNTTALL